MLFLDCASVCQGLVCLGILTKTLGFLFRKYNVIYGKRALNYNAVFLDSVNDSLEL